ncbi:unnamed protein product, partial [Vitis vinifera]|uniref:protein-serine/threonine phosphatase n=1 Tax=Vitis vinifera TaxID=29760 RepID=D7SWM1_VITVI
MEGGSGVAFGYIHKDLRLGSDEIARLRDTDLKNLLRHKKLYLVLDLDHTLLNSTRLLDITPEELYLKNQTDPLQGMICLPVYVIMAHRITNFPISIVYVSPKSTVSCSCHGAHNLILYVEGS